MASMSFVEILEEAVELTGGQASTAEDVISARRSLHLLLVEWSNRGFNTWRIEKETFTLSPEGTLWLPAKVEDVLEVKSLNPDEGCVDFLGDQATLRRVSSSEYAKLVTNPNGRPSLYYLERKEPPVVHVYPKGRDGLTEKVLIWYVTRPANFNLYRDPDKGIPGRWTDALVQGVASRMARKRPNVSEDLVRRLTADYEQALKFAEEADRQRVPLRVRVGRR